MATCQLTGFAEIGHTLVIAPAGRDGFGFERWHYELYSNGTQIFKSDDLSSLVGTSEDTIAHSALSFLTLRPGDVEAEYFDGYSNLQCAWRDAYAEELSLALYTDESCDSLARYRDDADTETPASGWPTDGHRPAA